MLCQRQHIFQESGLGLRCFVCSDGMEVFLASDADWSISGVCSSIHQTN
jgi:hypothetical protein